LLTSQLLTASGYTQTATADSASPKPLEYQFYLPPETVQLQYQASPGFKQGSYDYHIPVVRQRRFARRIPMIFHTVHCFQPFNAFLSRLFCFPYSV
jgi:hypothetical protein